MKKLTPLLSTLAVLATVAAFIQIEGLRIGNFIQAPTLVGMFLLSFIVSARSLGFAKAGRGLGSLFFEVKGDHDDFYGVFRLSAWSAGILFVVIGLVQVMVMLGGGGDIGQGIAIAFVAIAYSALIDLLLPQKAQSGKAGSQGKGAGIAVVATLLFVFFVILYAMKATDVRKPKESSDQSGKKTSALVSERVIA